MYYVGNIRNLVEVPVHLRHFMKTEMNFWGSKKTRNFSDYSSNQ